MGISDALVVMAVFAVFGFMIYSKLVKRNHPIIGKVKDLMRTKEKVEKESEMESSLWMTPHIERKIM